MKIQILILFFSISNLFSQQIVNSKKEAEIINIGSSIELFIYFFLLDSLNNTNLKMSEPAANGIILKFDKPWENPFLDYFIIINEERNIRITI